MNLKELISIYSSLELKTDRYLLAFSGGGDSVFLLVTLAEYYKSDLNKHIEIAYVNYHDSDLVFKEEEIVNHYIKKYNLILNRIDVKCPENENFENWAREIRYSYFREIIQKHNLRALLVAHQKDDLIETYIIQKNRNSLPLVYGLKVKTTINSLIIYRPLLDISKEEIYQYLNDNNFIYYEDKTNQNLIHERNRIRHLDISNEEKENLISELKNKNEELSSLYHSFSKLSNRIDFTYYNSLSIDEKKRLIFYVLSLHTSLTYLKIEGISKDIYSFLNKRETNVLKIDLQYYFCKTKDFFFVSDLLNRTYEYIINSPSLIETPFFIVDLTRLDLNLIKGYPLIIRNHKKDDFFSTDICEKNVDIFLKKHGVPFYLRDIYPVVVYENRVVYSPFFKDTLEDDSIFKFPYLS